jgi:hypothetical protein
MVEGDEVNDMHWLTQWDLFIGVYVAALAGDRAFDTRNNIILEAQKLPEAVKAQAGGNIPKSAYEFVLWKIGFGNKPDWLKA